MKNLSVKALMSTVALLFISVSVLGQTNGEWPQWRGASRDGISKETGLLKQWPEAGPPLAWKATGAGAGYSSFSISKGRMYTMGSRGDREFVVAFDVASGKEVWATPYGKTFDNDRGGGPRGTPTIDGDRVYALGGSGDLSSFDARTGKIIWTQNVLSKFGGSNIRWGISESPLVIGDKVLVNAGGQGASIVALKKADGSLIWKSQSDEAGYSSAIPVEVGGTTQVIFFTGNRAVGLDLRDGKLLWEYVRPSNNVANIATPVARGNRVWISSDYGTGGGMVEIKADGKAQEVYFTKEMRNHHSTSILIGDHRSLMRTAIFTRSAKTAWLGWSKWIRRRIARREDSKSSRALYRPGRIRWSQVAAFTFAIRTRSMRTMLGRRSRHDGSRPVRY